MNRKIKIKFCYGQLMALLNWIRDNAVEDMNGFSASTALVYYELLQWYTQHRFTWADSFPGEKKITLKMSVALAFSAMWEQDLWTVEPGIYIANILATINNELKKYIR